MNLEHRQRVVRHIIADDKVHELVLGRLEPVLDETVTKLGTYSALLLLVQEKPSANQILGDQFLPELLKVYGSSVEEAADIWRRGIRLLVWGTLRQWKVTEAEAEAFYESCMTLNFDDFCEIAKAN
jgi:hypothetical protein